LDGSRVFVVLRDQEQVDRIQWRGIGKRRQGSRLGGALRGMIASKSLPDTVFGVSKRRGLELIMSVGIVRGKTFDRHHKHTNAMKKRELTISSLSRQLDSLQLVLQGSCQLSPRYLHSFSRLQHLAMGRDLRPSQFSTIVTRQGIYLR
jgi:hypothetical protein